ncbi:MAG TPA: hypothetical protein VFA08_09150 [Actinomycetota bacterium]|nr:hypothetical protein [Actinomycetota bacterium]
MIAQPRITLTPEYNLKRLRREIAGREDETILVVGTGEKHRKLLNRLAREMPNVLRGFDENTREHLAYINPDGDPLAWRHDEPGRAPVVTSMYAPQL